MEELKPINTERDAKINISLNYQLYLQELIQTSTIAYMNGDVLQRSNIIEELKQKISFKIKPEDTEAHNNCRKELDKLKQRYLSLKNATTSKNSYDKIMTNDKSRERDKLYSEINFILDNWMETLLQLMDSNGLLIPMNKSGADAV